MALEWTGPGLLKLPGLVLPGIAGIADAGIWKYNGVVCLAMAV